MGHRAADNYCAVPIAKLPVKACTYRFDPYQTETAVIMEKEVFGLPEGTLHADALSPQNAAAGEATQVGFMPYPTEEFYLPMEDQERVMSLPKAHMARLFLGQLPYAVTDMQLQWLCYTFGHGAAVVFPERIVKKDPMNNNAKVPTGCVHAYCHPDQAEALMNGMHKRLLIDDTGVWYARNAEELNMLCAHTAVMKKDRTQRPFNRPYDTVVAQQATSTFVVRPPTYYKTTATAKALPPQYHAAQQ
jgi:hypothetical protein